MNDSHASCDNRFTVEGDPAIDNQMQNDSYASDGYHFTVEGYPVEEIMVREPYTPSSILKYQIYQGVS